MIELVVAADGSGDYASVQDAIDAVRVLSPQPVTIRIRRGVYREKVDIPDTKPDLTIVGEDAEHTVIVWNDHAGKPDRRGRPMTTFGTATMRIAADGVRVEHLTIANEAGWGPGIDQAVALYVAGDRCVFRGVRLLGWQDTLYAGRGRHYYADCHIEGHVDFIFGSATAMFDRCEIRSLRDGYVTAASTPRDVPFGFVFRDCRLTRAPEANAVYLGRPWRAWAYTVFIRTWMDAHIVPAGWDPWGDESNKSTSRYGEYASSGPGGSPEARVGWARQLSEDEAASLTPDRIFRGGDVWVPRD
ncbi:pectinesterase family protein [Paenibacillus thermoaerophilus]|uniref:Pectinesterase family protein n=1 Tax=Paenibacillus thermoaerophilus TaxID=1215385 RepID=A0ABW2V369_9BACL|nr:pectinesterase family protein [Paenibacillus thermoaerophilus]TMV14355.1 pectin esterase [Paenibacillus thermoaerophilus]